jgi:hypothetical protein
MRNVCLPLLVIGALSACGTSPLSDDTSGPPGIIIGDGGNVENDAGSLDDAGQNDGGESDAAGSDATIGLDVDPIDPRDTGTTDGGTTDGGTTDAVAPDSGIEEDTGGACRPGFARCDGELLLVCGDSGTLIRRRCDEGTTCTSLADGTAECLPDDVIVDPICEPLTLRCGPGGETLQQCTEDGIAWLNVEECPFGCDGAECLDEGEVVDPPVEACENPDIEPRDAGEFTIDLCDFDDTTDLVPDDACGEQAGEGSDYTFSFTVERPSTIVLEALDADPNVGVDTVVALRTACEDEASQIACHDDLACTESSEFPTNTCSGGSQPRHARITTTLEAGTFYAVVDHFDYSRNGVSFDCGITRVRLSIRPID